MKQIKAKILSAFFLSFSLFAVPVFAQWSTSNYSGSGLPTGTIFNILMYLMYWLLAIFGFIAIIGFVISGIQYLVSAGDDDMQKRAKKQMYYSITGVIVGLVGVVMITAVNTMLNANNNRF